MGNSNVKNILIIIAAVLVVAAVITVIVIATGNEKEPVEIGKCEEKIVEVEVEKVVYKPLIEDGINIKNMEAGTSTCYDGGHAALMVKLPKINLETAGAKEFNKAMEDIYAKAQKTIKSYPGNMEITYTSKYLAAYDIYFISVITYNHVCATGGTGYDAYFYDVKKDKVLTFEEFLAVYEIEKSEVLRRMSIEIDDYYSKELSGEKDAEKTIKTYQERAKRNFEDGEYEIIDVTPTSIKMHVSVTLDGVTFEVNRDYDKYLP